MDPPLDRDREATDHEQPLVVQKEVALTPRKDKHFKLETLKTIENC